MAEPALLLLDEPLSNLDAKLRESMRFEIKDVQRRFGVTVIYVTHDQAEAMVMSDRIVVMDKGCVQQVDVPRVIYDAPANQFVADFIGLINFLESTVVARAGEEGEVRVTCAPEAAPLRTRIPPGMAVGERLLLAVRPEAVGLSGEPVEGAMPGRVRRRIYLGNETEYRVALGDVEVRATAPAADDRAEGSPVWVSLRRIIPMRL